MWQQMSFHMTNWLSFVCRCPRQPARQPNPSSWLGIACRQGDRLAVSGLDQLVQFYFNQALAPSTTRSYESAKGRYLAFCNSASFVPLPVTEPALMGFVVCLPADGLASSSIKCYLSAVRRLLLSFALGDPKIGDMATLQLVLRGVKSVYAKKGRQLCPRLPITPSILVGLRRDWECAPHDYKPIVLWAACTTCFLVFCGLEREQPYQLTVLTPVTIRCKRTWHSTAIPTPSWPVSGLRSSKVDPFRKGVDVILGSTHNRLCPVAACLVICGHAPGPLFCFASGSFLTREAFVRDVRKTLAEAGFRGTQLP